MDDNPPKETRRKRRRKSASAKQDAEDSASAMKPNLPATATSTQGRRDGADSFEPFFAVPEWSSLPVVTQGSGPTFSENSSLRGPLWVDPMFHHSEPASTDDNSAMLAFHHEVTLTGQPQRADVGLLEHRQPSHPSGGLRINPESAFNGIGEFQSEGNYPEPSDGDDQAETCIRALSELSVALSRCCRMANTRDLSASPDITRNESHLSSSAARDGQLPFHGIPIEDIIKCSERLVEIVQNSKAHFQSMGPAKVDQEKKQATSNSDSFAALAFPCHIAYRQRQEETLTVDSDSEYSTISTTSSRSSSPPSSTATSATTHQRPNKEYSRWEQSPDASEVPAAKALDTSTLLLFLSCHERLLDLYSTVCLAVQGHVYALRMQGADTDASSASTAGSSYRRSRSSWSSMLSTGGQLPPRSMTPSEVPPINAGLNISASLLNFSAGSTALCNVGKIAKSSMELSLLLSMLSWFVDRFDSTLPELSLLGEGPHERRAHGPSSMAKPFVMKRGMGSKPENSDGGVGPRSGMGKVDAKKDYIVDWINNGSRVCKKQIRRVKRIVKNSAVF
ncbi:hypothetical protein BP5796_07015 [Coleophoma crateriformis]|uniref:Aflatoxin regulatory protein domain-containing protein n=1 Tax=Coleophoma crateriformis TaxID=565419 RepID=A0A3D8RQN5_9HELO|nr:hypothetical protein BP5796_07015 [Coleophoma crateriformis]